MHLPSIGYLGTSAGIGLPNALLCVLSKSANIYRFSLPISIFKDINDSSVWLVLDRFS